MLTSNLSSDAQKVQGIAGVTLGTALQLFATLVGGLIVSLCYGWKLALVAMTVLPFIVGTGYYRLRIVSYFADKAKLAYERSSQVACESVAAIRTVQGLTSEKKIFEKYGHLLIKPLQDGYRNAMLNTVFYAVAQSANFLSNSLVVCFNIVVNIIIYFNMYSSIMGVV